MSSEQFPSSLSESKDKSRITFSVDEFKTLLNDNYGNDFEADFMMGDDSGKSVKYFIEEQKAAGEHIVRMVEMFPNPESNEEETLQLFVDQLEIDLATLKELYKEEDAAMRTVIEGDISSMINAVNRLRSVISFLEIIGQLPENSPPAIEYVFKKLCSEITTAKDTGKVLGSGVSVFSLDTSSVLQNQ